jgi:hypothetical protein
MSWLKKRNSPAYVQPRGILHVRMRPPLDRECLLCSTNWIFNSNSGQWHGDTFFFQCFGFPLSILFHQCSILIFNYTLLLPEGQTGEPWEPLQKQCSFGNRTPLDRKAPRSWNGNLSSSNWDSRMIKQLGYKHTFYQNVVSTKKNFLSLYFRKNVTSLSVCLLRISQVCSAFYKTVYRWVRTNSSWATFFF